MKALILGGNGYLGSKIVKKLVMGGHYVVCTKRSESDISRLSDITEEITWIPASVDAVHATTQYVDFDCCLNMVSNYGRSNTLYDNVIEANIEFPLKVLNKIVENGIKSFLTIGTGLPERFNMYSFSKKIFSECGKFYEEKHHINFYNLKLEMFYGEDEPKDRFIPSLIWNMLEGKEVNTTEGTQRRDIISVSDIVDAICMILQSDLKGYQEIPVGTGIAPSISEIVDFIWEETGQKSAVHKGAVPMRIGEPDCIADVSILKGIGEWNPLFWKEGIKAMIKSIEGKENDEIID